MLILFFRLKTKILIEAQDICDIHSQVSYGNIMKRLIFLMFVVESSLDRLNTLKTALCGLDEKIQLTEYFDVVMNSSDL